VRALSFLNERPGDSEKALQELKALLAVFKASPEVEKFFRNPVVTRIEKRELLSDLKDTLPLTYRFLMTLADSNRLSIIGDVVDEFEAQKLKASGELSVVLQTARSLDESAVEEIRVSLQEMWQKTIKIKTEVNPKILGGFVARAPGKVLDASVVHQFEELRQQLVAR
jgi:F-type H+-transporting ATPase subunit delta